MPGDSFILRTSVQTLLSKSCWWVLYQKSNLRQPSHFLRLLYRWIKATIKLLMVVSCMTFRLVTAPGLVLTITDNCFSSLRDTIQEEGALSLKSNSVSDLCSVWCSHSPGRSSQDQMEARWCFGACSVSSCSSAHHALGGLLEAGLMQASPTILLTASKLANFCHFSANLVTCVVFLRGLDAAVRLTEEQCRFLYWKHPSLTGMLGDVFL